MPSNDQKISDHVIAAAIEALQWNDLFAETNVPNIRLVAETPPPTTLTSSSTTLTNTRHGKIQRIEEPPVGQLITYPNGSTFIRNSDESVTVTKPRSPNE